MAETTTIEWSDSTFNPWIGCTKVGPGCDHCYAETRDRRKLLGPVSHWGPGAPRHRTKAWDDPPKWQRAAAAFDAQRGRRRRVFCASMADVFDNEVDPAWRVDLFALIRATPNLDWLLLTKRVGNAAKMAAAAGGWPPNVWLGATIVNQAEADRDIPKLLATAGPAKRFLSMEPLLGPVDLRLIGRGRGEAAGVHCRTCESGSVEPWGGGDGGRACDACDGNAYYAIGLDWVIVGGEAYAGARPMHPDWVRSLRDQCTAASVPFLFKQWGEWLPWEPDVLPYWQAQSGELIDRHALPDFNDADLRGWTDELMYEGDDIVVHQRVGKAKSGRLLDGATHDGAPA